MVESMAPPRSSGFVDPGWEHGAAQDERKKKVKCNYCGKIVSGGIYRLKQHLARVSGEVTYCDKAPDEAYLKMKENLEGCRSNKKAKQTEDDTQVYLNFQSNDDEDEEEYGRLRRKGKQLVGDRNLALSLTPLRSLGYVDPGWDHGVAQDERKKKVKCNYCGKVVSGGINRFKQHLARIPGEVAPCKSAPEEVYQTIKDNMKWHRAGRRQKQPEVTESSSFHMHMVNGNEGDEQDGCAPYPVRDGRLTIGDKRVWRDTSKAFKGIPPSICSELLPKKSRMECLYLKARDDDQASVSCKQAKVRAASGRKSRKEVISAICKFFYQAGIPVQAADSLYFHKMLELVAQYGQNLVVPPSQLMSNRFLQEEIATIKDYLTEYRSSWVITGCSILADSWTDAEGRILINFLVSCPRGVYFHSSVDASNVIDDAFSLFKYLDKLVEEMGEENVVQVITQNTPTYKAAGKMLEDKRKNLFWTPCITYSIDRVLEDFSKLKFIGECMAKGQKITRLIYNQNWLLSFMKEEFTQGQELLRPAVTRHASSFATLHYLLDHRTSLKRMFQSSEWMSSQISKTDEGKQVEKIVLNTSFWKKVQYVKKSVDPVMQVLQMVETGENLSIPYAYSHMYRAKLAIKSIHGDDERKYGPFWRVIEYHWNSLFHHRLYAAAYFFNPSYRYRPDFLAHAEVVRAVNECIVRLEPDNTRRVSAVVQLADYTAAKADFGTELAISTRTELDPASWWQQHGISSLELQRVAIRVLSHTCSSFGCEHNWSIYDQSHSQRLSRLTQNRTNDLIYVHYNLRLREKQLKKRLSDSVYLDSITLERLLEDWILEVEKQTLQENEEIYYDEEGSVYEDEYRNHLTTIEDGTSDPGKGSIEPLTFGDTQLLDADPDNSDAASDGDPDLDFYDEEDDASD